MYHTLQCSIYEGYVCTGNITGSSFTIDNDFISNQYLVSIEDYCYLQLINIIGMIMASQSHSY